MKDAPFLFLIIQAEQKQDQFFSKIYGNFHQPTLLGWQSKKSKIKASES